MSEVITFPLGSADILRRTEAARLREAERLMSTPRGHFEQALAWIESRCFEAAAWRLAQVYRGMGEGRGFAKEGLVPDPTSMGQAFALLAAVPTDNDRTLRAVIAKALVALAAIAVPATHSDGAA